MAHVDIDDHGLPTTVDNQPSLRLSCHTNKSPDSPGRFSTVPNTRRASLGAPTAARSLASYIDKPNEAPDFTAALDRLAS